MCVGGEEGGGTSRRDHLHTQASATLTSPSASHVEEGWLVRWGGKGRVLEKRVTSSTALCLHLSHICLRLFQSHAADFKLKLV